MQQKLGRFEILRRLGQGAMGEVFLGRDPAIGREVALKTIRQDAAQGDEARERFVREARAAGTLNHPNLVTIHEFGEDEGLLYLAMEYVPGVDLEAMLRDRVLAPVQVLDLLAQVCDGLAHAHQKGVLHRDIKPSNVRVRREGDQLHAKVMDFGIARVAGSDMTGTGTLMGTFGYMAPEYIRTGVPDARSDLFAVGVILYEALAGRRPFEGDTTATVLYRVVNEEPAPLAASDIRGISPQIGRLLAKALAKDPDHRFQSAEAMARTLREAMNPAWTGAAFGAPTRTIARPPVPTAQPRSASRGRSLWSLAAVLMIVGGGGFGLWFWWQHRPPRLITMPEPALPSSQLALQATASPEPTSTRPAPKPHSTVKAPARMTELEASALLNEAAKGLVDQPQGSLALCDRVIRDHPLNPRAYALKMTALYGLGRYQEMPGVLDAGKEQGITPAQFLAFGHFTAMLREERRERRLPPEVRESLVAELPLGALKPGQGGRRRAQRPSRD
ncbi:serine/threonine-protein kinase [Geothrix sp. PMB-07]|uniref:serine/threonine-protein kinase n=1 Tax=Geothrix sp. PMB-07 TaxID=3068640 RepID=UPI002741500D|nr:serine/threonine-protein kinase [Geothrix sp. PMB-07]WLT31957.1 serine/threonine-protein kinase [Geothrix sp. PMB-07]